MSDFETVKQRADIVDLVGQYVTLQRAGRYFKACCPFHNEKTPSFYVYPEQQSWHCYGACATGGDVFTFIEKKENLSPVEALRLLADRYGVPLQHRAGRPDEPATARLVEANEAAAQYFHHLLLHAAAGAPARAYLKKRGLDADTVRAFLLGYSLDARDGLREHLLGRGFSLEAQEAAGLLTRGDRGLYDRFRGRLMFPIRDGRGRVIGFGGRVLGEGVPKYLNTPQTALFDKGGTLYALDRAREAIRASGAAVVVEGYMDAITAHQFGITNVVATLGTALTERHVTLLKRYARRVVLAMDADAAGIEAALRGEEVIRRAAAAGDDDAPAQVVVDWRNLVRVQAAAPVEVRIFTVPQGKDPDEAIRADPEAFRELARHAVPPFEFRLRHELAAIDRDNPQERVALADRLLPLVAGVADRAVQAQYLARLAQAVAIPEEVLAARLRGRVRPPAGSPLPLRERAGRHGRDEPTGGAADDEPQRAPPTGPVPPRPVGGPGSGVVQELTCLRLLLTFPSLRAAGMALDEDLFTDPANRALFGSWRSWGHGELHALLDDEGRAHLGRVLAVRLPPYDEDRAAKALTDVAERLRLRRLQDRERLLAAALRESEAADGPEAVARALAALAGGDAVEAEAAARLVQGVELARDRHAREVDLRTHGARVEDGGRR
jgi:DNA primase